MKQGSVAVGGTGEEREATGRLICLKRFLGSLTNTAHTCTTVLSMCVMLFQLLEIKKIHTRRVRTT